MIVDGLGVFGPNNTQQQQQTDGNTPTSETEEPKENTVQPTQESDTSADAGREETGGSESASNGTQSSATPAQPSGSGSGQTVDRAPAEGVVAAQVAPPEAPDNLEALARASAERAQAEARTQALIDSISAVEAVPLPNAEMQDGVTSQDMSMPPREPVDIYS